MTGTVQTSTLPVQGASLYYEVRGAGPLLLMIAGGPQDAGVFAALSGQLADGHRVVTYDPRGNSRSSFDGEPEALAVSQQADDAALLIAHFGGGPVDVFGTSGGAQIGLDLAARYPQLVRTLVAHEPPTMMLLDDPAPELAADQRIYDTYRREGVDAAMGLFFAMNGLADDDHGEEGPPTDFDASPEDAETFGRVAGNFEYWLAHGMLPLSQYRPDVAALRRGQPRIVVAIGEQSVGQSIHRMGLALATQLGVEPAMFPGDHMGFETFAGLFAAALDQALR